MYARKSLDNNQHAQYFQVKQQIAKLIESEEQADLRDYLRKLSDWKENIRALEELKLAVQLYRDLSYFQKKLNTITADLPAHSFLSLRLNSPILKAVSLFNQFKSEIFNDKKFIASGLTAHALNSAMNKLETDKNQAVKVKFNYPKAYTVLTQSKETRVQAGNNPSPAVVHVMNLFRDYYKKNSLCFFHWRHHDASAKKIYQQLNAILSNTKIPGNLEKVIAATQCILKEQTLVVNRMGGKVDIMESSFFRRVHFAVEMLDTERAQLNSNVQSRLAI